MRRFRYDQHRALTEIDGCARPPRSAGLRIVRPQVVVPVGGLFGGQRGRGGEDAAGGDVVGGAVDGFDADEPAGAGAEDREAAAFRVAADHRLIVADNEAGDLQFEVALVAPESRDLVVGHALADDVGGGAARLVDRVLHRFKAHPVRGEAGRIIGAIADRQDRRVIGH